MISQVGNMPVRFAVTGRTVSTPSEHRFMYIRAPIIAALFFATGMVSVQAADLAARPSVKAPAMVNSAYNWTGFYVGGHAGYS
jgi:hypothetical protein